jgi:hypothetical protein
VSAHGREGRAHGSLSLWREGRPGEGGGKNPRPSETWQGIWQGVPGRQPNLQDLAEHGPPFLIPHPHRASRFHQDI